MKKKRNSADNPKPARREHTEAEVEALLDRVDAALLSGETERVRELLGDLWAARRIVPEVLARRLSEDRSLVPAFALDLLSGFAGSRASGLLKRIAEERNAPDIIRFGARRRAGWPQRGQAKRRLAFLDTLADADGTLLLAAEQATSIWPPEGEILAEVVEYVQVLPQPRQHALTTRLASELGPQAIWPLHAILHLPDPALQLLVLKELVRLHQPASAGPIARLAKTSYNPTIRAEAAAALQRLQLRSLNGRAQPEWPALPPVERALLSIIDGDGGQAIIVVRRWAEQAFTITNMLIKDDWGIKEAFGSVHANTEQIRIVIDGLAEAGVRLIDVDLAAVRETVSAALEWNAAFGQSLPPGFELWEPFLHDSYPPAEGEPRSAIALDDAPYAGRADLIRASGQLAEHQFFDSWGFEPDLVLPALLMAPPPSGGRLTDRQYRPLIQFLVKDDTCEVLRQRLRRQAWLLEKVGDLAARDQALAVAAQLAAARSSELVAQPFLRALVERSVQETVEGMLSFG